MNETVADHSRLSGGTAPEWEDWEEELLARPENLLPRMWGGGLAALARPTEFAGLTNYPLEKGQWSEEVVVAERSQGLGVTFPP